MAFSDCLEEPIFFMTASFSVRLRYNRIGIRGLFRFVSPLRGIAVHRPRSPFAVDRPRWPSCVRAERQTVNGERERWTENGGRERRTDHDERRETVNGRRRT